MYTPQELDSYLASERPKKVVPTLDLKHKPQNEVYITDGCSSTIVHSYKVWLPISWALASVKVDNMVWDKRSPRYSELSSIYASTPKVPQWVAYGRTKDTSDVPGSLKANGMWMVNNFYPGYPPNDVTPDETRREYLLDSDLAFYPAFEVQPDQYYDSVNPVTVISLDFLWSKMSYANGSRKLPALDRLVNVPFVVCVPTYEWLSMTLRMSVTFRRCWRGYPFMSRLDLPPTTVLRQPRLTTPSAMMQNVTPPASWSPYAPSFIKEGETALYLPLMKGNLLLPLRTLITNL